MKSQEEFEKEALEQKREIEELKEKLHHMKLELAQKEEFLQRQIKVISYNLNRGCLQHEESLPERKSCTCKRREGHA